MWPVDDDAGPGAFEADAPDHDDAYLDFEDEDPDDPHWEAVLNDPRPIIPGD